MVDTAPETPSDQGTDTDGAADPGHVDGVVRLSGELDLVSAPEVRGRLLQIIAGTTAPVVVDMTDVTFLDSSGVGVIVAAGQRLSSEGRSLTLRAARGQVLSALRVSGLDQLFTVEQA